MAETKVTAIINPKGGVAKTETAYRMADNMRRKGIRVLLVDLDPQGTLSKTCGADRTDLCGIADVLLGQVSDPDDFIQPVEALGVDIAASNSADLDLVINSMTGRPEAPFMVKEALAKATGYDHVLIDTPGAFNLMTINALVAADKAIIPTRASKSDREELPKAVDCVVSVKKYNNPGLELGGFLVCDFDTKGAERVEQEAAIIEGYAEQLGYKVYQPYIRHSNAKEDRKNLGLNDYKAFTEQFLSE